MSQQFKHLFQPIKIGPVTVRNRILTSAHVTQLSEGRKPTPELIAYYLERARGGVGLIVIEAARVHPTSRPSARQILGYLPEVVPAYRQLTDALHKEGVVAFGQILHQGRQVSAVDTRMALWSASPIAAGAIKEIPHEMTRDEIREVVEAHALTASNLKAGGVDGIEIHGAHGYLIQQFLSPFSNKRKDEYGGSLENRLRFAFEVIDAVRAAVGKDLAVGMRISAEEFVPGGIDGEAAKVLAPLLVGRGLDYLAVSQCTYEGYSYSTMIPDMHFTHGQFVYLAAGVREALHQAGFQVPVMTVGRIIDPMHGEQILADGQADMVTMTRAMVADPEMPRKAMEDRLDDIRPCVGCNQGCAGMVHIGRPITCTVNPTAGRELEWGAQTLKKAECPKRVLVIGGGPAGLEAARVAALRGHQVTLWEQGWSLGGQLVFAVQAANRREFDKLSGWLETQVKSLGVEVRLGMLGTAEAVLAEKPDAVVVATGSMPSMPEIPGAEGLQLLEVSDALSDLKQVGNRVVVLDHDRHFKAAGIAEHLADLGREVTLVTHGGEAGIEVPIVSFPALRLRLGQRKVRTLPFHDVVRAEGRTVVVADNFSGREEALPEVDAIVYAGPNRAEDGIAAELRGRVPEVYLAGDCMAPRRALDAMREGHAAGRAV